MDKSWMHSDRRSKAYEFGVEAFLNFAVENLLTTTHIRCPCVKCVNLKLFGVGIIRDHVYFNGIDQSYKNWTFHGEPWEATTNASRNVEEDDGHSRYSFVSEEIDMDDNDFGDFGSDPYEFANVIGDGDQPVYPGCRKYTKLSALVKLYNLKAKHGMSDVCFTELLILQGDLLPEGNTIPTSMYEAKKTLCALGLSYEKMHACPNDCILYRKEYEDSTNCPTCGISRWKEGKDSILKEGVPAKVVWYFPPIPRFKRMFQSHETAKSLTWHAARKSIDGQMSHPADSLSWKLLDDKWPEFGNEPRNLRLALSSDGFNPHSSLSKIGHRNDQFVFASQVKQIFFVDNPMHRGWSVVLSMPNREYNDVIGDEVLGDVIIECEPFTRGMPNLDTFDELVGELGGQNIRGGKIEVENLFYDGCFYIGDVVGINNVVF
ncbi:hypothetical protein L3X38_033175 [Prunus dulcis]|uniref:Transposase-associated domain-containing protein n=1 Tax=Prunus dulcis TaxID=3755 RepID=A0AAD4VH45_PRUDU|nr:hypothetical protein L3X38_033175 [Prunus dulcis]